MKPRNKHVDRSVCNNFGHADAELRTVDGRVFLLCANCGSTEEVGMDAKYVRDDATRILCQAVRNAIEVCDAPGGSAVIANYLRGALEGFDRNSAGHEAQAEPGGWKPGSEPPSDTDRLRSIHENGLCDNWLEECGERHCGWERFLELVDEQVEMDAHERTPEFHEELRQAIEETATRTIVPSGAIVDLPPLPEQST